MGLSQCCICCLRCLRVLLSDLLPTLPPHEGMIPRPELSRPAERCNKVACCDTGCRPVRPGGLSRFNEVNPSLLDRYNGDSPPGDMGHSSLEEGQEKCVPHLIFHRLKRHPYTWGDALHKGPLLLEGLLQACVGHLQVPMCHPRQGGHRFPSPRNLLLHPLRLHCLRTNKAPELLALCHDLYPVPPKEGLCPRDVPGRHDQDALGRILEGSLRGPSYHQVIKVASYARYCASCPIVISIPYMCGAGVGRP